jgi:copper chaperone CopZ
MGDQCHVEPIQKTPTPEELEVSISVWFAVYGMGCRHCAARVHNGLLLVNGVVEAQVDHLSGMAQVSFNPCLATIPALLEAVERAGGDGRHRYQAVPLG